jgi:hypothetical protein
LEKKKLELKNIQGFVLLLVLTGMLVGVGVLVLDRFGDTAKTSTTIAFGSQNVTLAGGAGTLTNDEVTSLLFLGNSSINFTVGTQVNLTNGELGTILASYPKIVNGSYIVSYVYDADSAATTGLNSGRDAVSSVATDWLSLIVVIGVLALILVLVIRSFVSKGR